MRSFFGQYVGGRKEPLIETMRSVDYGYVSESSTATAPTSTTGGGAPPAAERPPLRSVPSLGEVSVQLPPAVVRRNSIEVQRHPLEQPHHVGETGDGRGSRAPPATTAPKQQYQYYTPPLPTAAGLQAAVKHDVARPLQQQQRTNRWDPAWAGEHSRSVDEEDRRIQGDRHFLSSCFPPRRPRAGTDEFDGEIASKIPASDSLYAKFQTICVRSGMIYAFIVVLTAASMVYGVSDKLAHTQHRFAEVLDLQVAFLGNAYFFVNDIPRLLEAVSQGHVYQNSCLHAGGSLSDLWITGNGMYSLWQTDEAVLEYLTTDDGGGESVAATYDYGLCSVTQILQGSDEYIGYGNKYGKYYSDGLNPCIMDSAYAGFVEAELVRDPVAWDYVILVEQTKRMAVAEARNDTVYYLTNHYGPLIKASGAIPVIVDTHSFWSSNSNMTGLTDIPTFTSLIAEGVADFTAALASALPKKQAPLVAPIGLAYLTVWEEDFELWEKLFLDDGIHSSMYGSYMFACVLYASLFGQLPEAVENMPALFMDARKIVGQATYPSADEAEYMRNVAGRVTLTGFVPQSLLDVYAANGGSR